MEFQARKPENPPGFVVRTEAQKPAWDNGYRLERGVDGGWLHYASTTAPGDVWIAGLSSQGPWLISIDHSGVAAEIRALPASPVAGPGIITFLLATLSLLHSALDRVYKLAVSLTDAPLARFRMKTKDLPQSTDAERLVVQRVGQELFRDALMDYWGGQCPLTGITEPALLRASHIVPGPAGMPRALPARPTPALARLHQLNREHDGHRATRLP